MLLELQKTDFGKIDSESTRIYINFGDPVLYEITMMTHIEATYQLIMVQLVPRIKEGLQVLLELKR